MGSSMWVRQWQLCFKDPGKTSEEVYSKNNLYVASFGAHIPSINKITRQTIQPNSLKTELKFGENA